MCRLIAVALFALPLAAADNPKPKTQAEYDAQKAALDEKLKKGDEDYTAAAKRIEAVYALDGARKTAVTYTDGRGKYAAAAEAVADIKKDAKPDEKLIAKFEKQRTEAAEQMEKALKLLAEKHPDGAKELVKAVDDRDAARKVTTEVNEAIKKLGPRPR